MKTVHDHIIEEIDKLYAMYLTNATKDNKEFMRGFSTACDSIKIILATESLMETMKACGKIKDEQYKEEDHY